MPSRPVKPWVRTVAPQWREIEQPVLKEVTRGFRMAQVDVDVVKREAEVARELMKEMQWNC